MNPLIITAFTVGGAIGASFGVGVFALIKAARKADHTFGEADEPDCLNCYDCGWVCESHRDQPWEGISSVAHACNCGGAGSPCPVCQWDMATAGIVDEVERAHSRASDALTTKNQRIERALACVTENSAHVGKKMARILRGDA